VNSSMVRNVLEGWSSQPLRSSHRQAAADRAGALSSSSSRRIISSRGVGAIVLHGQGSIEVMSDWSASIVTTHKLTASHADSSLSPGHQPLSPRAG